MPYLCKKIRYAYLQQLAITIYTLYSPYTTHHSGIYVVKHNEEQASCVNHYVTSELQQQVHKARLN